MEQNPAPDSVLEEFATRLRQKLGSNLRRLILFGSRARGHHLPDADYDCLVVVGAISAEVREEVDAAAGDALYRRNAVMSAFLVTESDYESRIYSPLLINVRREGVTL